MDEINQNCNVEPAARRRRAYCWLPVALLEPGMVLARPLTGGADRVTTMTLAAGTKVTASTIAQIINKGVESVAVQNKTRLSEDAYAERVLQYEARLHQIFGAYPDDDCRALLEALLAEGPDVD